VPPEQVLAANTELEKIRLGLESQLVAQVTAQVEVNKVEAANKSIFVAGWRPFIGWICGSALGCQFIIGPLVTWFSAVLGHPVQFPSLDYSSLSTILLGMLGLGGLHTYERVQGVQNVDKLK
jgi:hypothetical protein